MNLSGLRQTALDVLIHEFEQFIEVNRASKLPSSTKGKDLFDSDDVALLDFLKPKGGSGPTIIQPYKKYHDFNAGNFVTEIIQLLNEGRTVILDLCNAPPEVMEYFSKQLSTAVFYEQVDRFSSDTLGDHFVELYFEEAHNLFHQVIRTIKRRSIGV